MNSNNLYKNKEIMRKNLSNHKFLIENNFVSLIYTYMYKLQSYALDE